MRRSDSGADWTTADQEDLAFLGEVEAVLAASRVLIGVAVRSLAPVEDTVTLTQFRALVIIASRGPMHLAALAEAMQVHPSNATRACDRLVASGLADRRDNPADRRHLLLDSDRPGPCPGGERDGSATGGDPADPASNSTRDRTQVAAGFTRFAARRRTRADGSVVHRLDHRIPRDARGLRVYAG
jgi:hypothetical protein